MKTKNREKYAEEIKNYNGDFCCFVRRVMLKRTDCIGERCAKCRIMQVLWLDEEYEEKEPEVDWTKVPVDTKILVKHTDGSMWHRRYFSKYEKGKVYAYENGKTSWTARDTDVMRWDYAKLFEEED